MVHGGWIASNGVAGSDKNIGSNTNPRPEPVGALDLVEDEASEVRFV